MRRTEAARQRPAVTDCPVARYLLCVPTDHRETVSPDADSDNVSAVTANYGAYLPGIAKIAMQLRQPGRLLILQKLLIGHIYFLLERVLNGELATCSSGNCVTDLLATSVTIRTVE